METNEIKERSRKTRFYLIEGSLFHLCPAKYQLYHSVYVKIADQYHCCELDKCSAHYPSILGDNENKTYYKLVSFSSIGFDKRFPNCDYIDL